MLRRTLLAPAALIALAAPALAGSGSDTIYPTQGAVVCAPATDAGCTALGYLQVRNVSGAIAWYKWASGSCTGLTAAQCFRPATGTYTGAFKWSPPLVLDTQTTAGLLTYMATVAAPDIGPYTTYGYATVGDMGGGSFFYDSSDTTTADNGGTVRVDGAGHRFKLVAGERVYISMFGVLTTNSASANSVAFQKAADWLRGTCYGAWGGAWTRALWGKGGTYNFDTSINFTADWNGYATGAAAANKYCTGMTVKGEEGGNLQLPFVLSGNLTSGHKGMFLDFSGQANTTLDNVYVKALGYSTAGVANLRVAAPGGGVGGVNFGMHFANNTFVDGYTNPNLVVAVALQDADLTIFDPTFSARASLDTSIVNRWGFMGQTLYHAPNGVGIAQGGTSSTITLASTASSVNDFYKGLPIHVCSAHTASGACDGTRQLGYIDSYTGSSRQAHVEIPWLYFTPTSSSAYSIGAVGSQYQHLAGLSSANGATQYIIGGQNLTGQLIWTGGLMLNFTAPYMAGYGSVADNIVKDDGIFCSTGSQMITGTVNTEVQGASTGGSFIRLVSGAVTDVNVTGRVTNIGSARAVYSADAGGACSTYFTNINAKTGSIGPTPMFSMAAGTGVPTQWAGSDVTATAFGSIGDLSATAKIPYCGYMSENQGTLRDSDMPSYCETWRFGSLVGENKTAFTKNVSGRVTPSYQYLSYFVTCSQLTGDSAAHDVCTFPIPGGVLQAYAGGSYTNGYNTLSMHCHSSFTTTGVVVTLRLNQGGYSMPSDTVTLTSTDISWDVHVSSYQRAGNSGFISWDWKIYSGKDLLASGKSGVANGIAVENASSLILSAASSTTQTPDPCYVQKNGN